MAVQVGMNRMKSAFELAMERAMGLEEPDEEQKLEWELAPKGRRLAGSFLKGQGTPFTTVENESPERRPFLIKGMMEALVSNLQLPKNDGANYTNTKVMEGIERLLAGKAGVKELLERVKYVTEQYRQFGIPQREQAYAQLKAQFEAQVMGAMSRQMGQQMSGMQVNVETMPEFQQQWLSVSSQMDSQYEQHLEDFRKQLLELA